MEWGRWKHTNPNIYSEIELKYLHSSLQSMVNEKDAKHNEFQENEGMAIISQHWQKTFQTLEHLMNLMNMMYYYQKIKVRFNEFLTKEGKPSLDMLEKVMNRCFKLYGMIDHFMKIFKLIQIKDVSF